MKINREHIGKSYRKGNRIRTIVGVDFMFVYYKTKSDYKKGTTKAIIHPDFNKWFEGAEEE